MAPTKSSFDGGKLPSAAHSAVPRSRLPRLRHSCLSGLPFSLVLRAVTHCIRALPPLPFPASQKLYPLTRLCGMLSPDLRERILASDDNLEGTRQEIAERYGVWLGIIKKLPDISSWISSGIDICAQKLSKIPPTLPNFLENKLIPCLGRYRRENGLRLNSFYQSFSSA